MSWLTVAVIVMALVYLLRDKRKRYRLNIFEAEDSSRDTCFRSTLPPTDDLEIVGIVPLNRFYLEYLDLGSFGLTDLVVRQKSNGLFFRLHSSDGLVELTELRPREVKAAISLSEPLNFLPYVKGIFLSKAGLDRLGIKSIIRDTVAPVAWEETESAWFTVASDTVANRLKEELVRELLIKVEDRLKSLPASGPERYQAIAETLALLHLTNCCPENDELMVRQLVLMGRCHLMENARARLKAEFRLVGKFKPEWTYEDFVQACRAG